MHTDLPTRRLGPKESDSDELAARLAEEMVRRWHAGERPAAEEFFERHPELLDDTDVALRLIYEEICLHQEIGESLRSASIFERFPQWREPLKKLLECHQLLDTPAAPTRSVLAEGLDDFVLLAELGHGAQGRVYLANQPALGDRLVVLKVTKRTGREHLTLARLQHTHIMPLYAVHDDPIRNLRTLCMPYLGGASLQQVLAELQETPLNERTGLDLLNALDRAAPGPGESTQGAGDAPIRRMFARFSYVEAICWIGACLADALQHAHERGLIHMDLKPSNVLLASDAQPLLLDFHIAQKPIRPGEELTDAIGGTPLYMSPEQRSALHAVRAGTSIPAAVDGRSDLYSLGLMLYEALSGRIPSADPLAAKQLSRCNPGVSAGLADIVGKCTCPDPAGRYATASELAADLRRHLVDLPLRGVRNRSATERWHKWRRHHPHALSLGAMASAVLAAAISLAIVALGHISEQRRAAELALVEGEQQLSKHAYSQAVDTLARGAALSESLPGSGGLADRLARHLRAARRGQAAEQLHVLVERLRFLCGTPSLAGGDRSAVTESWRAVWDRRLGLKDRQDVELAPDLERRLDADLLDLGIIGADVCFRRGDRAGVVEALQVLADTEAMFGTSQLLCRQRSAYAAALGQEDVAEAARRQAGLLKPQSAWEYCALGRALLQQNELTRAAAELASAVELEPQGFWPNFYEGICAYRQDRFGDAAAAFRVCIALAPDRAECHFNRALANAALGHAEEAVNDYGRALQRDPRFAAAALNRGMLYFKQKRYADALTDLHTALALGSDAAQVHYNIALVQFEQHDRAAALTSTRRALQANANFPEAKALLKRLQRP